MGGGALVCWVRTAAHPPPLSSLFHLHRCDLPIIVTSIHRAIYKIHHALNQLSFIPIKSSLRYYQRSYRTCLGKLPNIYCMYIGNRYGSVLPVHVRILWQILFSVMGGKRRKSNITLFRKYYFMHTTYEQYHSYVVSDYYILIYICIYKFKFKLNDRPDQSIDSSTSVLLLSPRDTKTVQNGIL